jgi:hypothetical protein
MRNYFSLKPQDVLVLLKLILWRSREWRQNELASELGLSAAELVHSLERLQRSQLLDESKKNPRRSATLEFLSFGLKYVFPAEIGRIVRGMPTAHSALPLSQKLISDDMNQFVWTSDEGSAHGMMMTPLYPTVPMAAAKDAALYELLALVDSLRIGRPREQKMAIEELRKRILPGRNEAPIRKIS